MRNDLLYRIQCKVIGVKDEMRGVVAFKLQHKLQVVAEVVLAQTETARQVALVVTTCNSTYQPYFRLVVEAHTVQCFVKCELLFAAFHAQDTVSFKHMSGLEYLQLLFLSFGYQQFEIAVYARLQRFTAAPHRVAVQEEHSTCNGNSTLFIQHPSRQTHRCRIRKVYSRCHGIIR